MDTTILAQIEQQAEQTRERVKQVKTEICALLADDLPEFVKRELKKAFLAHPDVSNAMSDDTLKQLQIDISTDGLKASRNVLDGIEDDSLWFISSTGKTISDNSELWSKVSVICATVAALKKNYGFPSDNESTVYKAPTWFIGGRYLPTLSEKYWALLTELAGITAQLKAAESHDTQSELAKRWGDF